MPRITRALYRALSRLRPAASGRDALSDHRLLAACERAVERVAADPGAAGQVGRDLFAEVRHTLVPAYLLDAYKLIEAALDAVRDAAHEPSRPEPARRAA